jgi:hypothetical protein
LCFLHTHAYYTLMLITFYPKSCDLTGFRFGRWQLLVVVFICWYPFKCLILCIAQQQQDLVVIGGGPGGYVAAIKAAQLGMKVESNSHSIYIYIYIYIAFHNSSLLFVSFSRSHSCLYQSGSSLLYQNSILLFISFYLCHSCLLTVFV